MMVTALSVCSLLSPLSVWASTGNQPVVETTQQAHLKVTGTVVDAKGEPVVAATVKEAGTGNAVITDVNGNFSLQVREGATLQFSSIGYSSVQVKARGQMKVTMKEDETMLGEVVSIGYGKAKKGDLSSAIGTVANMDKLQERPVSSVSQMLQGQIPGVSVVANGGHPGQDPTITIRGVGSINGETPLYVVDGVPGAPFNLSDVTSITVLKDAAYGYMVKTYAYWAQHDKSQWANIPALVDKVEKEGDRGLLDNYADVFKIDNNWSKEYIFSVNSSSANYAGSEFPGIVLENKGWGIYNGWGNFKPTLELYAEYNDKDTRRDATILKYGDSFEFFGKTRRYYSASDNECGFQFNKYMDGFADGKHVSSNGDRPTTDLNLPLLRFADLLLFKAEALIMQGKNAEAAEPLNRIANRAKEGVTYTNPTMMDLMHERRCELAGEWTDRRFDLIRWANSGTEAWNDDALNKLRASKHGLKHVDRSDPDSPLDTTNGKTMVINGKTYQGVMDLANFSTAKTFERNGDNSVFPYRVNTVVQANGKLKQNHGYAEQ